MPYSIPLTPLLSLLSRASRVTGRPTLPILRTVKLTLGEDRVTAESTDLDHYLVTSLATEGKVAQPAVCVNGKILCQWLNLEGTENVDIAVAQDDHTIHFRCNDSRLTLLCLSPDNEFPAPMAAPPGEAFEANESELAQLLHALECYQSKDEARYVINGIHVEIEEGEVWLTATDGKTLGRAKLQEVDISMDPGPVGIIASSTVRLLLGLLSAKAEEEKVSVWAGKNVWRFSTASWSLSAKMIEGTYPNVQQVIPKRQKARKIEAAAFSTALSQVVPLAGKTDMVRLEFGEGDVRFKTSNPDIGEAESACAYHGSATPIAWAANADYLSRLGDQGDIEVEITTSDAAGVFRRGKGFLAVIMPMRIQP